MSISNPRKQHQHQGAGSRLAALHEGTRYEKRFSVLRCQAKPLGFHRAIISPAPVLPTTRRHGSRTCCSASGRLRGFYTSAAPFFLCYSCFSCIKSSSHLGRLTLIFFSILLSLRGLGGFPFYLEIPSRMVASKSEPRYPVVSGTVLLFYRASSQPL